MVGTAIGTLFAAIGKVLSLSVLHCGLMGLDRHYTPVCLGFWQKPTVQVSQKVACTEPTKPRPAIGLVEASEKGVW